MRDEGLNKVAVELAMVMYHSTWGWRQEDDEFKASLNYIMRHSLKTQNKTKSSNGGEGVRKDPNHF
jgi:hypothetical protein